MKRVDIVSAVIFMLLGGFAMAEARRLPKYESFGPGGDFMPFWLGVILIVLATLLLVLALRSPAKVEAERLLPPRDGRIHIASIVASLCLYTFVMEYIGYLVSTFLFLAFLVAVLGKVSRQATVIVSAGGTLLFTAVFTWLLRIPLPRGFLPF